MATDDYMIINGSDTRLYTAQAALEKRVREYMARGWTPLGGVVYVGTVNEEEFLCYVFCQALVRTAETAPIATDSE